MRAAQSSSTSPVRNRSLPSSPLPADYEETLRPQTVENAFARASPKKFSRAVRPSHLKVSGSSPYILKGPRSFTPDTHLLPTIGGHKHVSSPATEELAEATVRRQQQVIAALQEDIEHQKRLRHREVQAMSASTKRMAAENRALQDQLAQLTSENASIKSKLIQDEEQISNLNSFFSQKLEGLKRQGSLSSRRSSTSPVPVMIRQNSTSSPMPPASPDLLQREAMLRSANASPSLMASNPAEARRVHSPPANLGKPFNEPSPAHSPKSASDYDDDSFEQTPRSNPQASLTQGQPEYQPKPPSTSRSPLGSPGPSPKAASMTMRPIVHSPTGAFDLTDELVSGGVDNQLQTNGDEDQYSFATAPWGGLYRQLVGMELKHFDCPRPENPAPRSSSIFERVLSGHLDQSQFQSIFSQGIDAMSSRARTKFFGDLFSEVLSAAKIMRFQNLLLDIPGDLLDLVSLTQLLLGRAVMISGACGGRLFLVEKDQFVLLAENISKQSASDQLADIQRKRNNKSKPNGKEAEAALDGVMDSQTGFKSGPGSSSAASNLYGAQDTVMESYSEGPMFPFSGIASVAVNEKRVVNEPEPSRNPDYNKLTDSQFPHKPCAMIAAPVLDEEDNVVAVIIVFAANSDSGMKSQFSGEDELLTGYFAKECGKEFKQCIQYRDMWRKQLLCHKFSSGVSMLDRRNDVGAILTTFASQLRAIIGCQIVAIYLLSDDRKSAWRLASGSDPDVEVHANACNGLLFHTWQNAAACVIDTPEHPLMSMYDESSDVSVDAAAMALQMSVSMESILADSGPGGIQSLLSAPLVDASGMVFGVLQAANGSFQRVHSDVVSAVAAQIEGTLTNATIPVAPLIGTKPSAVKTNAKGQVDLDQTLKHASHLATDLLSEFCRLLSIEKARLLVTCCHDPSKPLTSQNASGLLVLAISGSQPLSELDGATVLPVSGMTGGAVRSASVTSASDVLARSGGEFDPKVDRMQYVRTSSLMIVPLSMTGPASGCIQALNPIGRDSFDADDIVACRLWAKRLASLTAQLPPIVAEPGIIGQAEDFGMATGGFGSI